MNYKIIQRPEFGLAMTNQVARLMQRLSSMHYDGRCKAAGQPGPDGFINGWVNWTNGPEAETLVILTAHQMDTAMKIIEMLPTLEPDERALLLDLRATIIKAMREAKVWQ